MPFDSISHVKGIRLLTLKIHAPRPSFFPVFCLVSRTSISREFLSEFTCCGFTQI